MCFTHVFYWWILWCLWVWEMMPHFTSRSLWPAPIFITMKTVMYVSECKWINAIFRSMFLLWQQARPLVSSWKLYDRKVPGECCSLLCHSFHNKSRQNSGAIQHHLVAERGNATINGLCIFPSLLLWDLNVFKNSHKWNSMELKFRISMVQWLHLNENQLTPGTAG